MLPASNGKLLKGERYDPLRWSGSTAPFSQAQGRGSQYSHRDTLMSNVVVEEEEKMQN